MAAFPGPLELGENMTDIVRADGHLWLKYGQKNIHNTSIIRCYYKCYSSKNKPACRAKKTVDYDRRLPISSATTQTKYSHRSHNHSTPLNDSGEAISQGSCPSDAADSSSIAQGCSPNSAKPSSCNSSAVITTHNTLASPPNITGTRLEPSARASSAPSRGELPGPASSGGVVSSSLEAGSARPVSLTDADAEAIAANLLPQSIAFTSSSESAALAPSPAISSLFNSCELLPTESENLCHFFAENYSLGGRWPCAEKRVRLTPSDEATSTEVVRYSAGYHCRPSSRVFEALSADPDQLFFPEPFSPRTADAADDVVFGLAISGTPFDGGLVAASPEEGRARGLAHGDDSFEDFLSELTPELDFENFWREEPPWLEAADVSPSWEALGRSDGSSSHGSQEPHRIGLKRCVSAMLTGTETGNIDGSTPGHVCVPRPMSTSSSVHSVFSFLGGSDTLSVSDLMKDL